MVGELILNSLISFKTAQVLDCYRYIVVITSHEVPQREWYVSRARSRRKIPLRALLYGIYSLTRPTLRIPMI